MTNLQSLTVKIQNKVSLETFLGQRVGVDGNLWLHRAAVSFAESLALDKTSTAYVDYFMEQVASLKRYGVIPVIVFADKSMSLKDAINKEKESARKAALGDAMNQLSNGELTSAKENFEKAIEVTPLMIDQVVKSLESKKVEVVYAGYEAGAQLTHLCKIKYVKAAISDDFEMLVYGCPSTLFNLDICGNAIQIDIGDLFTDLGGGFDFTSWTHDRFRRMYIVSGCACLSAVPGMDLATAYRFFTTDESFENVLQRSLSKYTDIKQYTAKFVKAEAFYLFQYVYFPKTKSYQRLHNIPAHKTSADYQYLGDLPTVRNSLSKGKSVSKAPGPFGDRSNLPMKKPNAPKSKSPIIEQIKKNLGKENIAPIFASTVISIAGPSGTTSSASLIGTVSSSRSSGTTSSASSIATTSSSRSSGTTTSDNYSGTASSANPSSGATPSASSIVTTASANASGTTSSDSPSSGTIPSASSFDTTTSANSSGTTPSTSSFVTTSYSGTSGTTSSENSSGTTPSTSSFVTTSYPGTSGTRPSEDSSGTTPSTSSFVTTSYPGTSGTTSSENSPGTTPSTSSFATTASGNSSGTTSSTSSSGATSSADSPGTELSTNSSATSLLEDVSGSSSTINSFGSPSLDPFYGSFIVQSYPGPSSTISGSSLIHSSPGSSSPSNHDESFSPNSADESPSGLSIVCVASKLPSDYSDRLLLYNPLMCHDPVRLPEFSSQNPPPVMSIFTPHRNPWGTYPGQRSASMPPVVPSREKRKADNDDNSSSTTTNQDEQSIIIKKRKVVASSSKSPN